MKIGVSAFAWTTQFEKKHLPILSFVREQGIAGFEIPMFDPAAIDAPAIRKAMAENELECTVCAILPPGINPISSDAEVRRRSAEHLVRCIEKSAEMGAALIAGPLYAPIGYLPERRRTEEEWNRALECFLPLVESLERNAVNLAIEPVNRSETFFLKTVAEAKLFCDAVGHPRLGITVDTFHANIEEKSIPRALAAAGDRLMHVHASENDRGLLGSGHVDFPTVVSSLREIGYRGFLMIEGFGYSEDASNKLGLLWADPAVSPEALASRGAAYLQTILNDEAPAVHRAHGNVAANSIAHRP